MTGVEVGCGTADITPEIGTVLSGFIFRENKPSTAIDDPLTVRVLLLRQDRTLHFLISYELLGISAALQAQLLATLAQDLGSDFSPQRCVLLATHTHSAPPASPLEGEADPDPAYWQLLGRRTVAAARQALERLSPAALYIATLRVPGLTYNRRAVLLDGRVSMALEPDGPVLERGPVDDTLTVLVWRDARGKNLAGVVHFACHGVAVCTQAIGGDIPGELTRRLERLIDAPCLFLQGAAGDINPLTVAAGRPAMRAWTEQFAAHLQNLPDKLLPLPNSPLHCQSTWLPLDYQPLPGRTCIEQNIVNFDWIARGGIDSPEVQPAIRLLGNLMNFEPGQRPDPAKAAYAALALARAERRVLAVHESGQPPPPCSLHVSLWRLGPIVSAFVAAELFALTGFKIRALGRSQAVLPVTYAAPVVGYVPDRAAMAKGGYEVDFAWRFYRHPALFATDSEQRILKTVHTLLREL